ncbi:hypothetical protein PHYBOEH_006863 [Phytophthora boehmeriae]|uniref:Secreted protein n=1 Tax=Phytophthora boehmeriae TaxID=109152 RepID=A0A8T1X2K9_9STRA|nr:hypothetical protein PHYBOEH_006863 [Phytophthora boehmeriae]
MKTSWTALFMLITTALIDFTTATCSSECQSQLVHFREEACQKWRERLPRPDLFNHCGQGFNSGKYAGCEGFCQAKPDEGMMKSLRLDACTSLKGVPPQERQQACQAGFSEALDLAKDAAVYDSKESQPAPATVQDANAQGNQGAQDAASTGGDSGKRKVTVKKVNEPERKNLLDDARKEAMDAFGTSGQQNTEL